MKRLASGTQKSTTNDGEKVLTMANKTNKLAFNESTFLQLFSILQVCGILMIICTLVWTLSYHGAFSWSDSKLRFNFHPILMLLGMIYLSGNSLLIFRVLREQPKPLLKVVHAAIHISAFTISLIGSIAVFTNHLENNLPNLYSLHSWIGGLCMTLFAIQYMAGFYSFLYPGVSGAARSALLPYHVISGFIIFGLATIAALTGFAEKMGFSASNYSNFSGRMWWMNFAGILLISFSFLVFYLVGERLYKRTAIEELIPLTTDFKESNSIRSPSD